VTRQDIDAFERALAPQCALRGDARMPVTQAPTERIVARNRIEIPA